MASGTFAKMALGAALGVGAMSFAGQQPMSTDILRSLKALVAIGAQAISDVSGSVSEKAAERASDGGARAAEELLLKTVDEKLGKALNRMEAAVGGSRTVHVVSTGSGGWSITTTVVVVGVGGAVLTMWKGKFVTREHLSAAVHTVTEGITGIAKTVEHLRSNMKEAVYVNSLLQNAPTTNLNITFLQVCSYRSH